jgi:lipopolysaccharide transport system ATP-binding protein
LGLARIDLEVKQGERLGIIGRNGAGKSTLLKLLTGNLAPTEGQLTVNGSIQALLTAGAGFHPEFSGIENIQSSLTYQGLTSDEINQAIADISEFTELGDFLGQPFKMYSAGMQARLTFATATVLKPDILIVDEILGAGDAYFFGKSIERMKELVLSGATVLIVSHALDQIARFCERAIWVDRGRIVYSGPALETIRAYEEYIHKMEDRRLQAKNRVRKVGIENILTKFFQMP